MSNNISIRTLSGKMSSSEGSSDGREASDAEVNGKSADNPGPVDGAVDADLFGSGSDDEGQA